MIIERTQTVTAPAEIVPDAIRINEWFSYRAGPQHFVINRGSAYQPQPVTGHIVNARLDGYIDGIAILCARISVESVKPGRWL